MEIGSPLLAVPGTAACSCVHSPPGSSIPIPGLQATSDVLQFMAVNGQPVRLLKIVICRVPTAFGMYRDFSVIALFDMVVAVLEGAHSRWTVLDNQFSVFNYAMQLCTRRLCLL